MKGSTAGRSGGAVLGSGRAGVGGGAGERKNGGRMGGPIRLPSTALLILLALLVAAGLAAGFPQHPQTASEAAAVAMVNGEPVTAGEWKHELQKQRSSVIAYFRQTYGGEADGDFWEGNFGGETPAAILKERALEAIVYRKLLLQEAKAYSVVEDTAYAYLLAEMERENKRRLEAQRAGRPVYGPLQFSEDDFTEFYLARIAVELKEAMASSGQAVTEEQLRQHYEQIKDPLFRQEDEVIFQLLSFPYRSGEGMEVYRKDRAQQQLETFGQRLERGEAMEESAAEVFAAAALPPETLAAGLHAGVAEAVFDSRTARYYYRALPGLYEWLNGGRQQGDVSPVIDDPAAGRYVLAAVLSSSTTGYRSFSEQRDNVRKHYMEGALERRLNGLRHGAVIKSMPLYHQMAVE
ncbi:SurA N-terminal domain-containing protein [Paenibacillus sp. S150]|uniref:SurA N-terminal domain-containing protein n=1 Tax=Paenibacillus sp. S150 TaxID=2749826 RepID=UPI001C580E16|nr:SurA N-terminal domain-containing protein [Paenibacillus sp. S150]MBW4085601.1 SurA N-terminal domain-containing protein [Paenibacillus sp. S150]